MSTGFIVNTADLNGDLSTFFKPKATAGGLATNFIASDARDLSEWFEMSTIPGDQIAYDTNYICDAYGDLKNAFVSINYNPDPISFSPSENFVLVQTGSNYVLSCTANSGTTNTVTFNVGISNVNFVIVAGGGGGGSSSPNAQNGGGGGEGGQTLIRGPSTVQNNDYVTLIIGDGGNSSTIGNSSTTNYFFNSESGSWSANPGDKGDNATASIGGAGGNNSHNGGNGGRGGYSSNNSVNGSASTQTIINIFGTDYYFGGGGGGGSRNQQVGSSFGGLGGGGGGGNSTNGNNGQIYTTPYNVSYNPATRNSFPNSGGGGSGGNGNGSTANNPGGMGNSGIIVIYFTYP
jgi:hypothetical protein